GLATYLFARETTTPAVATLVGWHILGGIVLSALFFAGKVFRSSLLAAFTGLALLLYAAAGYSTGHARWLYLLHVLAGCPAGAGAAWALVRHRRNSAIRNPQSAIGSTAALSLMLASGAAFAAYTYAADAYYRTLTATNAAQAGNPLFP